MNSPDLQLGNGQDIYNSQVKTIEKLRVDTHAVSPRCLSTPSRMRSCNAESDASNRMTGPNSLHDFAVPLVLDDSVSELEQLICN